MSQPLPFDEFKFDENVEVEDIFFSPDDSDIGYFAEVDLSNPDKLKEKTEKLPSAPANKKIDHKNFTPHMIKMKLNT